LPHRAVLDETPCLIGGSGGMGDGFAVACVLDLDRAPEAAGRCPA
jgi:hypothetical protein